MDIELKTYTYDGDTPPAVRAAIRSAGHVVITNPDMLHTGILPHHTKWVKLFENLRYVVLDELHTYRGVFGSHVANVLRRLRRICEFYGSHPVFICTSATIANPAELARHHIEDDVVVIDESGAPRGEKVLVFVNPPVVNRSLGVRKSALLTGRDIAATLLASGVQTIAFARSRVQTELLLTYLRSRFPQPQWPPNLIRGYRGGYLPSERRAIERGLRDGSVRGVVSTNALELGIDIGALQAAVLLGYPGSVASTWQQMGRAGRREDLSVAFLVATSSPTDQYVVQHPEYVLDRSPEAGLVNPDNLHILVHHLKCAAFEIPFDAKERFGTEDTPGVLAYLDEQGVLHESGGKYHWSDQAFPAETTSLRTATNDNVVIIDTTGPAPRTVGSEYHDGKARVIGEIDRFAAQVLLHEQAIYLHESKQLQVERLDWENAKAYVREVKVDYYTQAELAVRIRVIDEFDRQRGTARLRSRARRGAREHAHLDLQEAHDVHARERRLGQDPPARAGAADDIVLVRGPGARGRGLAEGAHRGRARRSGKSAARPGAAVPHVRPARPRSRGRGALAAHRAADDLPVRHDAGRHRVLRASVQVVPAADPAREGASRVLRLRVRLPVLRRPGVRARAPTSASPSRIFCHSLERPTSASRRDR